ncbi:MAG: site-specific DNA-methyltransferase [Tissierellia bacterium]|nr:site-specific DNA-methyltransferase [Tissierellia bacterium]
MSSLHIIERLPEIISSGKKKAEEVLNRSKDDSLYNGQIFFPESNQGDSWINQFYQGDNLLVMGKLIKEGYKGKLDLIYIDPPFLTKTKHNGKINIVAQDKEYTFELFAYDDTWEEGLYSYLKMIYPRLYLMRELLSDRGTIYVHLDYRTVHYVRILMDEIFGEENFMNEIIWAYKSGGVSKRYYSRKHDNILVYTKTKDYIFNPQQEKSYNRDFKPYKFKGVKEYQDEIGWYTLVNLKDVWQIDMVGRTSRERVNYASQKPEALMERIILTSTDENSIVADFFAGSGTTGIVAERLNRRWIMSDKGDLSSITIHKRLLENASKPFYSFKENNRARDGGKLLIKGEYIDNKTLKIHLERYVVDIDISIKKKYRQQMEELIDNSSLSLIEFIGIDLDFDGKIPLLRKQYTRDSNKALDSNMAIEGNIKEGQKILVAYKDVFGKGNYDLYQISQGRLILCQEY